MTGKKQDWSISGHFLSQFALLYCLQFTKYTPADKSVLQTGQVYFTSKNKITKIKSTNTCNFKSRHLVLFDVHSKRRRSGNCNCLIKTVCHWARLLFWAQINPPLFHNQLGLTQHKTMQTTNNRRSNNRALGAGGRVTGALASPTLLWDIR
jgi:hypothetical protein